MKGDKQSPQASHPLPSSYLDCALRLQVDSCDLDYRPA